MKKILYIIPVLSLILTSCSGSKNTYNALTSYASDVKNSDNELITLFDSSISLTTYNKLDYKKLESLFNDTIQYEHKLFDRYNYYKDGEELINNLKVINDNYATGKKISVDDDLFELLSDSIKITKLSDGYFNPSLGALIDLYSSKLSPLGLTSSNPSDEEINRALTCSTSLNNIEEIIVLDSNDKTVTFNRLDGCNDKVIISLGGIAKGYAIEKMASMISETPSIVDGGRSSMVATSINPNPSRDTWNIAILEPNNKEILGAISVKGMVSFSTSGDYESYYFDNDGVRHHHILNPYSGKSENYYRSISLISTSNNAMMLDALSTSVFNLDSLDKIEDMINRFEEAFDSKIEYLIEVDEGNKVNLIVSEYFNDHLLKDTINYDYVNKIIVR